MSKNDYELFLLDADELGEDDEETAGLTKEGETAEEEKEEEVTL